MAIVYIAGKKFFAVDKFDGEYTGIKKAMANKWYVDEIYDTIIVKPLMALANMFKNIIEKSGIDGAVNGVGKFVQYSSRQLRLVQSGQVGNYILMMIAAFVVIIFIWINDGHIFKFISKIF